MLNIIAKFKTINTLSPVLKHVFASYTYGMLFWYVLPCLWVGTNLHE